RVPPNQRLAVVEQAIEDRPNPWTPQQLAGERVPLMAPRHRLARRALQQPGRQAPRGEGTCGWLSNPALEQLATRDQGESQGVGVDRSADGEIGDQAHPGA